MSPSPLQPIYHQYTSLTTTLPLDPQSGLGGKLLYAGEIDPHSRNLLFAANIAGAALIAASADPAIQRQAVRDSVIDFLVNSLSEALRILKNEIRKHETVSVAVSIAPEQLVAEMLDRGVLPDLLPQPTQHLFPEYQDQLGRFQAQGSKPVQAVKPTQAAPSEIHFVTWSIDTNFTRWLPQLDQIAKSIIPADDHPRHRWLRLSPRYLGRPAQRQHGIAFSDAEADQFQMEAANLIEQSPDPIDLRIEAHPLQQD